MLCSCQAPNPVYTSAESMLFIQNKDKDKDVDFDTDDIPKKKSTCPRCSPEPHSHCFIFDRISYKIYHLLIYLSGTRSQTGAAAKGVEVKKGPKQKSTPAIKDKVVAGVSTTRGHWRLPKQGQQQGPTKKTDINAALKKIKALNKKYSKDDKETEEEDILGQQAPQAGELGESGLCLLIIPGRESLMCAICNLKHNNKDDFADDDCWVFCPMCEVLSHVLCLRMEKCICGFKPSREALS